MLPSGYETQDCSVARALEILGERWTLLIVRDALHGVARYDEFLGRLGVPTTTLSRRLNQLVAAGVLYRHRYDDRPPRDEYRLTPAGRELAVVIESLREWGDRHVSPDGPPADYLHRECGGSLVASVHCDRCGERVVGPGAWERVEHRAIRRG
ncbi:MAG TPA: helix-turn-helix domain-containing protein [Candidatus Dormibacteraeota bacterium]|nr:helix-turn-helix domain-containing protein [Candidatus Dormibacteraeota bacterium]